MATMTATVTRRSTGVRPAVRAAGRAGLVARGTVYLVLAGLAVQIALDGRSSHQANSQGALATVAGEPYGKLLLILLAIGLSCYALWRFSQAAFGTATDGKKAGPRIKAFLRGLVYAGICATAVEVLAGSTGGSQSRQQSSATAHLMRHAGGRWLVGIAGVVVGVIGISMIITGLRRSFRQELETERMSARTQGLVVGLGAFGHVARGVVIAVAGGLITAAAVTTNPRTSTGLDGALRTMAHQAGGSLLLGVTALGLAAFGAYCLAAAKWQRL